MEGRSRPLTVILEKFTPIIVPFFLIIFPLALLHYVVSLAPDMEALELWIRVNHCKSQAKIPLALLLHTSIQKISKDVRPYRIHGTAGAGKVCANTLACPDDGRA